MTNGKMLADTWTPPTLLLPPLPSVGMWETPNTTVLCIDSLGKHKQSTSNFRSFFSFLPVFVVQLMVSLIFLLL